MKQLSCRKCEGHGIIVPLKGHAPHCPFNHCLCHRCSSVMTLRASALVRRFRHRAPDTKTALIKTVKSKNGNMRLRILPKNGRTSPGGTEINYDTRSCSSSLSSITDSSTSSSNSSTPSPPLQSAIQFFPISDAPPQLSLDQVIFLSQLLSQSAFSYTPSAFQQVMAQQSALFETSVSPMQQLLLGSPLLSA